ncbi:hypothetical protein LPW11_00065 [Geomonas sp. RF6]|uniref:hypothetical protein n=1 Tax=Geomonas sp. RF6 TaxID=2897342 RepID=UPI001E5F3A2F|nr:hypothetical protein [Geomonas sp. RF6]UFS70603.1 hypothetical protein LPW11_00065 [Geomonas sp. RF6]
MKRLVAVAVGGMLAISMVASVGAAPAARTERPKQQQGIVNAKKVMKHRLEREKKMHEVRKQGQLKKKQAAMAK